MEKNVILVEDKGLFNNPFCLRIVKAVVKGDKILNYPSKAKQKLMILGHLKFKINC